MARVPRLVLVLVLVMTLTEPQRTDRLSYQATIQYCAADSPLAADALTVSPYLGFGSLNPAVSLALENGRGLFVLAATSNPEGASVQKASVAGTTLAQTMVDLGDDAGVRTTALLTDMSAPLGLTVGNAIEVEESVEVLAGGGPDDVVELTVALAREMLLASGIDEDPAEALADGRAMDVWKDMIRAQGGDPEAALPTARESHVLTAPQSGTLSRLDALAVVERLETECRTGAFSDRLRANLGLDGR